MKKHKWKILIGIFLIGVFLAWLSVRFQSPLIRAYAVGIIGGCISSVVVYFFRKMK